MTWYNKFGYKYNPLVIKPVEEFELFFDDKSLVEDVIEVIERGENLILKGPLGTGKTSILKKIIDEFGGDRKLFYYNAFSASNPLNFEKVLRKAGGFFSRTFSIMSKNVVLFIDEAQHLSKDNLEELEDYIGTHFRSVILASSEEKFEVPKELTEEFKSVINIGNFTENDAKNIIKDRLGADYSEILNDKEIKVIYEKSKTPRDFLLKCDAICKDKHEVINE